MLGRWKIFRYELFKITFAEREIKDSLKLAKCRAYLNSFSNLNIS